MGVALAVVKTGAAVQTKGDKMAEVPSSEGGRDPNFPAHARNYEGFLTLLKWSIVITAIITAAVIFIISN